MTRFILLLSCVLLSINSFAQDFSVVGVNNDALLNTNESAYFDTYFKKTRDSFSFSNKHALFLHGGRFHTKVDYFEAVKRFKKESNGSNVQTLYYILSPQEKLLFDSEVDVIICYWRKVRLKPENIPFIAKSFNNKK